MTPEAAGRLAALAAQAKLRDLAALLTLRRRDAALLHAATELVAAEATEAAAAAGTGLAEQAALDAFRAATRKRRALIAETRRTLAGELETALSAATRAIGRERAAARLLREAIAMRQAAEARREEQERPPLRPRSDPVGPAQ